MSLRQTEADEKQRREFCARLFLEPARLVEASRMTTDAASLRTEPHAHGALLQLDLALHCGGSVTCEGQTSAVKPASAFAFYPGARHSHALKIISPETEVITLKLAVEASWPALKTGTFAKVCHAPLAAKMLAPPMRRLAWLSVSGRGRALAALVTVAEVISLWPGANDGAQHPKDWVEAKGKLENLLELIDQSLSAPPDIREMAEVATLSPRQLSRQFAALMGCSPHAYVTARRLARAKEMLGSGRMTVSEVGEALGFANLQAFSRWFQRETRVNPSAFRKDPGPL